MKAPAQVFFSNIMMLVSKVDIGPLRAKRSRVPPTFRTLRPINRPFVLHVGRVMKSILHFCASTSGGRLMTLISILLRWNYDGKSDIWQGCFSLPD